MMSMIRVKSLLLFALFLGIISTNGMFDYCSKKPSENIVVSDTTGTNEELLKKEVKRLTQEMENLEKKSLSWETKFEEERHKAEVATDYAKDQYQIIYDEIMNSQAAQNNKIGNQNITITKDKQINDLGNTIKTKETEIAKKDNQIKDLQNALNANKDKIKTAQNQIYLWESNKKLHEKELKMLTEEKEYWHTKYEEEKKNKNTGVIIPPVTVVPDFVEIADTILNQLKIDQGNLNIYIMEDQEYSIKEGIKNGLTREDIIKILKWNIEHDFTQYANYKKQGNLDNLYQMLKINKFLNIDEVIKTLSNKNISEKDIIDFVQYTDDYDFNSLIKNKGIIATLRSNHNSKIQRKIAETSPYYNFDDAPLKKIFEMKKDADIDMFDQLNKRSGLTNFESRMQNILNVAPHVDLQNVLNGLNYDLDLDEICKILKMNFPNPDLQKIGELRKTLPDDKKTALEELRPNVMRSKKIFQDTKNGMSLEDLWKKFGYK